MRATNYGLEANGDRLRDKEKRNIIMPFDDPDVRDRQEKERAQEMEFRWRADRLNFGRGMEHLF